MMEVMMILDSYPFGIDTAAFQELNRNSEWRWPSQDVFEGIPALQFTGPGRDTITLPGVIFPEYWGGTGQLDVLRGMADSGAAHTLIDGRGNVLGEYVITSVQERQSVFTVAGIALRQEFTLTLERYARGFTPSAVGGSAGAQLSAVVVEEAPAAAIASDAEKKAVKSEGGLADALASVQDVVASVTTPLSNVISAVNRGIAVAKSIQTTATVAQQTIKALGNINSLSSAQSALNGLILTTGSAAQASTAAGRAISDTLGAMTAAGEAAEAIGAVRGAMIEMNRLAVGATSIRAQAEDYVGTFA